MASGKTETGIGSSATLGITPTELGRLTRHAPKGRLTLVLDIKPGDDMPVRSEVSGQVLMVPYLGPRRTYYLGPDDNLYLRLRYAGKTEWVWPAKRSGA